MTYSEALKELKLHQNKIPSDVSLFIAAEGYEKELWAMTSEEDNSKSLRERGLIENENLQVYATFKSGNTIYYPTLEYFLAIQNLKK